MSVSPFGVKIISYEHKGDEWETKIEKFNMELLEDIFITFNLDLSSYKKYEYNFVATFTFLKDDIAYILFKKADGTNVVYSLLKKNDNKWIVIKKESMQGTKMPKELLWYMYKHLINE